MTKPSDRLIARLIAEGYVEPGEYRIARTYAGFWQRTQGAFSWDLVTADGHHANVGSQYTVKECADAKVWEWWGEALLPVLTPGSTAQDHTNGSEL